MAGFFIPTFWPGQFEIFIIIWGRSDSIQRFQISQTADSLVRYVYVLYTHNINTYQ